MDQLLAADSSRAPGIQTGTVVEVTGPPGSGKTLLGLVLALRALKDGNKVLWVSTNAQPLPLERMAELDGFDADLVESIRLCDIQSLSHLILLAAKLMSGNEKYALVVIEDIAGLVGASYGLALASNEGRTRALTALLARLRKAAETTGAAILCMSAMLPTFVRGANDLQTLVSGVGSGVWTKAFASRITLYRGWDGTHWARAGDGREVPFRITRTGITDAAKPTEEPIQKMPAPESGTDELITGQYDSSPQAPASTTKTIGSQSDVAPISTRSSDIIPAAAITNTDGTPYSSAKAHTAHTGAINSTNNTTEAATTRGRSKEPTPEQALSQRSPSEATDRKEQTNSTPSSSNEMLHREHESPCGTTSARMGSPRTEAASTYETSPDPDQEPITEDPIKEYSTLIHHQAAAASEAFDVPDSQASWDSDDELLIASTCARIEPDDVDQEPVSLPT